MKIGHKIKVLRELKNYTQEYMSEKIGLSQSNYSKIERDETDITFSRLEKISEVLGIKVDDLINLNDQIIFNNYGEYKGTQSGNYIEFPKELIDLYKDKITLLEEKVKYLEDVIQRLK